MWNPSAECDAGDDFGLGMNPEFLTEGTAVRDFQYPDRLVFGAADQHTLNAQRELYAGFDDTPIIEVNNSTAEMIKYMSNALLATMISFANEFANLSEAVDGIDMTEVQRGVHLSRYLTAVDTEAGDTAAIASFVEAGCGFGGSCLPKDVRGLVRLGEQLGCPMHLLDTVLKINATRKDRIIKLLNERLGDLDGKRIAILGLAFRPDTSDVRESPAIPLITALSAHNASIAAYDPKAIHEMREVFGDDILQYCSSLSECIANTDAIVVVTKWDEFRSLPTILANSEWQPLVVDGRRMLDPNSIANYTGIGFPGG